MTNGSESGNGQNQRDGQESVDSILEISLTNPPCIQKILSSTIAAIGKQLKQSVNVFQVLTLYRRLPE